MRVQYRMLNRSVFIPYTMFCTMSLQSFTSFSLSPGACGWGWIGCEGVEGAGVRVLRGRV